MKHLDQSAIDLLNNRVIFEEIHQLKLFFTSLFAEVANEIPLSLLTSLHSSSQGTKISKGNELERSPYQVLDIVRDFNKDHGFNIRLLNWWGRGLFVFVFLGKDNLKLRPDNPFLGSMLLRGYKITKTSSPWDYHKIIDQGFAEPSTGKDLIGNHLYKFEHVQVVKKIIYSHDYDSLKVSLKREVEHILHFYIR